MKKISIILSLVMLVMLGGCTIHKKMSKGDIKQSLIGHRIGGDFGYTILENSDNRIRVFKIVTEEYSFNTAEIIIYMEVDWNAMAMMYLPERLKGEFLVKYEWVGNKWRVREIINYNFSER